MFVYIGMGLKRAILTILLGLGVFSSQAQQYFNRRYTLHSYNTSINSIVPVGNRYYCTGLVRDSTYAPAIGITFTILDSNGNVLLDSVFTLPYSNMYPCNGCLIPIDSNRFIYGASDVDTSAGRNIIVKYNGVGEVFWHREYDKFSCPDQFWNLVDFKPTGTDEWLVLCTNSCVDSTVWGLFEQKLLLYKLDSNFNVEWSKQYGADHFDNFAEKLMVTNSGYLILGLKANDNQVPTGLHYFAEIIKTDTSGRQLWDWLSAATKETGPNYDFIQTKDGGYIYSGMGNGHEISAGGGTDEIVSKGWIEKLDSNRNVVWNDTFSTIYSTIFDEMLSVIKELPDSNVVVAGEIIGGFNSSDTIGEWSRNFASLIKYRPNGDRIWQRKYSYHNDSLLGYIYDMKQTADGGFVLCGESDDNYHYYGNTTQQAWVIKVDSNGCLGPMDPQCLTERAPQLQRSLSVKIFPNPTKEAITIESDYLADHEELTITNAVGQTLLTQRVTNTRERIEIKSWPTGVYIYYISAAGSSVQTGKIVKY